MKRALVRTVAVCVLLTTACMGAQHPPSRTIDRCAQDGLYFYPFDYNDLEKTVDVSLFDVGITVEHKKNDAVITYSVKGHQHVDKIKDFAVEHAWLTVSRKNRFAVTWNESASASDAQLFEVTAQGDIVEDSNLMSQVERAFQVDARRVCKTPGSNAVAVKWIDDDRLLMSENAWASGMCYSNFTEGFVVNFATHKAERKLTERQMIDLPAVCTRNLVPVGKDRHVRKH